MAFTLRSYNKKMRQFNQPPIKRSRRKFAEGGVSLVDKVSQDSGGDDFIPADDQRRMDTATGRLAFQSGGYVSPHLPPPVPGVVPGSSTFGRAMSFEESGGLRATPTPKPVSPIFQGLGMATVNETGLPRMASGAGTGPWTGGIGRVPGMAAKEGSSLVPGYAAGGAVEEEGLRKGFAAGGRIGFANGTPEESELMTEEERRALEAPQQPLLPMEPGTDVGRVQYADEAQPRGLKQEPQVPSARQPLEVFRWPTLRPTEMQPSDESRSVSALEGSALEGGQAAVSVPVEQAAPAAAAAVATPVEDSETEFRARQAQQAGETRATGLRYFGLDPFSTRDSRVTGSPGITKSVDPKTGKTLYSNTFDTSQGRVSTVPSTYKEDTARLNSLIQARIASGHPEDLEKARQLAVTPEQKAMIAEQEQLGGLRQRADRGSRAAMIELQGRESSKLSRANLAAEMLKLQLGREPTQLQLAEFNLRERELAQKNAKEGRAENTAANQTQIQNVFGDTPEGKAQQTRFHQQLMESLPGLKDASGKPINSIDRITPELMSTLAQGSKVLAILEKSNKPWFGKNPQFNQLLDAFNKAEIVPKRGMFNAYIKTPLGEIKGPGMLPSDVDEGTWRFLEKYVRDLHQSQRIVQPTLGQYDAGR